MKTNPFTLPLIVAGAVLTLVGVLMTVLALTGEMTGGAFMVALGSLLLTVGSPVLVGGLVLAGVDWRLRQS